MFDDTTHYGSFNRSCRVHVSRRWKGFCAVGQQGTKWSSCGIYCFCKEPINPLVEWSFGTLAVCITLRSRLSVGAFHTFRLLHLSILSLYFWFVNLIHIYSWINCTFYNYTLWNVFTLLILYCILCIVDQLWFPIFIQI